MSAFWAGVTPAGPARRHRNADALEQVAHRQLVPVAGEVGTRQRRREPVAGEVGAMTLGARGLVDRRAARRPVRRCRHRPTRVRRRAGAACAPSDDCVTLAVQMAATARNAMRSFMPGIVPKKHGGSLRSWGRGFAARGTHFVVGLASLVGVAASPLVGLTSFVGLASLVGSPTGPQVAKRRSQERAPQRAFRRAAGPTPPIARPHRARRWHRHASHGRVGCQRGPRRQTKTRSPGRWRTVGRCSTARRRAQSRPDRAR